MNEAGWWRRLTRVPTGSLSVWKYNWLAVHKEIDALRRAAPHVSGDLLDVGCGSRPFERLFAGRTRRAIGIDLPDSRYTRGARVDAYARAESLPFRDATFDAVLATSVLTHLREPVLLPREAARVLKPGGVLVLEATQMAPLHDAPHDYFRFTRYGVEHLVTKAGLECVECIPVGGLCARVGLALIAGLNRINRGPTRVVTEIPVRALYVVIQVAFELLDRVFFTRGDHLGHVCVARKPGASAPR